MYDQNKAHYISITGIVIKDGKFLITKRAPHEKAFPNMWTVPGGKVELNDYTNRERDNINQWYNIFENVLRREVSEETGLSIKNINYLTSLSFIRPDNIPTVVVSFYADHEEGNVALSKDSIDHAWVTVEEAEKYDLIDGIHEELVMVDRILQGRPVEEWKKGLKL